MLQLRQLLVLQLLLLQLVELLLQVLLLERLQGLLGAVQLRLGVQLLLGERVLKDLLLGLLRLLWKRMLLLWTRLLGHLWGLQVEDRVLQWVLRWGLAVRWGQMCIRSAPGLAEQDGTGAGTALPLLAMAYLRLQGLCGS